MASIEARMSSSRLPGKMFLDICGKPVIERVVERIQRSKYVHDIVIATSVNRKDDVLESWALSNGIACYRGSEENVLQRVIDAHQMMDSDIVVEICGDTPLLDPIIIDLGVKTFLTNNYDVVTNTWIQSYPQGIDVQVFKREILQEVPQGSVEGVLEEHVSLYFYENPHKYKIFHLQAPSEWCLPDQRLQLDYKEDLRLIRRIYELLEPQYGQSFGIKEIIKLFFDVPELKQINSNCIEKPLR